MNNSNAVFLDRDGVLNLKKDDYVKNLSELEIFPFIAKSIKKLQQLNFKIIVITNQSGVARGMYGLDDVNRFNKALDDAIFLAAGESAALRRLRGSSDSSAAAVQQLAGEFRQRSGTLNYTRPDFSNRSGITREAARDPKVLCSIPAACGCLPAPLRQLPG